MEIKNVTVIGAGLMGRQIAMQCALSGYDVIVYDAFESALEKAKAFQEDWIAKRVAKGKMSEEDVNEFMNESQKLLTHKTIAEKGAQKVKDGINLVNETLNVDIVHSTGNLINNVATKFVGGFANKASDVAQGILNLGKGLFKKKK